ncbi:MAG TPA: hypothetical protein VJN88_04525, partial [Ktedonobacterales bacterium]|nr:hypothetical protein [Ktedonobacterales bacterium]
GGEDISTLTARSATGAQIEIPATPATPSPTPLRAPAMNGREELPAPPSGPDPERPPYPIAWLFPPGAPIPRPYRNAPPRPDRAFWNNPCRW